MRNLLLAFVTVLGVAGCGDDTSNFKLPDLAFRPDMAPQADLSAPLNGCNGYLMCLIQAMTVADQTACDNGATQMAMDLNDALNVCLNNACFNAIGDGGTPFCIDNNDMSSRCKNCITNTLRSGGTCGAAYAACLGDKP
jgi:hypothetical protein